VLGVVVLLVWALPAPAVLAQSTAPRVLVAPTCLIRGTTVRIVIQGLGFFNRPVSLSRDNGTPLGTVTAGPSPVGQVSGTFTFTTTVTADAGFRVLARQGTGPAVTSSFVDALPKCGAQVSVRPTCLTGTSTSTVTIQGTDFGSGTAVRVAVDQYGPAEAEPRELDADESGGFTVPVTVRFTGATVPVVVTWFADDRSNSAVAFVDPCPPPPTTTTTATTRPGPVIGPPPPGPGPGSTTTTTPTLGIPPPGDAPPGVPPVTLPSAKVSISPRTVRPGRCVVIVVFDAPAALPVSARFADGPVVNSQTGPGGGTVLSVCHSHDSGVPLGPVQVLIGIGPLAPVPVFTVLRVPPRPQPPLLQSGADSRRS